MPIPIPPPCMPPPWPPRARTGDRPERITTTVRMKNPCISLSLIEVACQETGSPPPSAQPEINGAKPANPHCCVSGLGSTAVLVGGKAKEHIDRNQIVCGR